MTNGTKLSHLDSSVTYRVTFTKSFVTGEVLEGLEYVEKFEFPTYESSSRFVVNLLLHRKGGGGEYGGSKWTLKGNPKVTVH